MKFEFAYHGTSFRSATKIRRNGFGGSKNINLKERRLRNFVPKEEIVYSEGIHRIGSCWQYATHTSTPGLNPSPFFAVIFELHVDRSQGRTQRNQWLQP